MQPSSGSEEQHKAIDNSEPNSYCPKDAEFHRRVLNHLPTPVAVVNDQGQIVYFNKALLKLGGLEAGPGEITDFVSFIHPDDRDHLMASFSEVVECPTARILGGHHWAEIFFRLVAADGTVVLVELVGSGGLYDDVVGGIIYEVRPAARIDLLRRVLDGLSRGESMLHLLSLIGEMIASPPLDLEAVVLQSSPGGGLVLAASTSAELAEVVRGNHAGTPWEHLTKQPAHIDPADLPFDVRDRLTASSFRGLWHVSVESPLTATTLRIIAASPHQAKANSPLSRLERAQEIAAAVLLRTQVDVLLAHAAEHDTLTDLPNRAAFYQLAESLDPMLERGALRLDLDGLKPVNDSYGAFCGDAVLQIVADRVRATCSSSDIIGRIGDDEFAILLTPGYDGESEPVMDRATRLAAHVLDAVNDTIVVGGRPLRISASIGVAAAPPNVSTDHLLAWADAAMHDAKAAGGGQIRRFGVAYG